MTQDKVASVVLVLSSRAMPHGKKGKRLQTAYPSNKVWTQLKFMGPSTSWVSHKIWIISGFSRAIFSVPQFERQGGCAISSLHVPRSVICSAVALLLTQKSLRLGAPLWSMSALVEKPLVGLNSWDLKSSTPE